MAAVVAALHVAPECRGAAALDREHGAPPRGGQRRAMLITESLAEAAEHLRHFRPLVGHGSRASGGHLVRRGWRNSVERFKWADGGAHLAGGDHEILSRGAQVAMAEQQLDGTQVGASLQQVYGEGVPQRMRRNRLADPALRPNLTAGPVDGERADRSVRSVTREQPCAGGGLQWSVLRGLQGTGNDPARIPG